MASPTSSTLTPLLSPRAEPEFVKPIPTPLAGVVEKPSAAFELLLPICLAAHRFDFKYALDFMTSTWADVDGPRPLDEFGSNQDVVDKTVLKILQETFTYLKSKPIHSLSKEDFEFVTRLRTYAYGAIVLFTVEDNDPARRWCKIMSSCLKDQSFDDFAFRLWYLVHDLDPQTYNALTKAALWGRLEKVESGHGMRCTVFERITHFLFWYPLYPFRLYLGLCERRAQRNSAHLGRACRV